MTYGRIYSAYCPSKIAIKYKKRRKYETFNTRVSDQVNSINRLVWNIKIRSKTNSTLLNFSTTLKNPPLNF